MKQIKLGAIILSAMTVVACGSAQNASAKDVYQFYLAEQGSAFSQANGTLDRGGVLNVTYKGETFNGQNANNKIDAKGSKGNKMNCAYTMPGEIASGTCKTSDGRTLNMKFE